MQHVGQQIRSIYSKSRRNKTAVWVGTHKLPNNEEQLLRSTQSRKPFALGRDNVHRSFEPLKIPPEAIPVNVDTLGYKIWRTQNGSLPVYTDYRNGRSNILTIIRRTEGDLQKLCSDLSKFVPSEKINLKQQTGHVVVAGNYQRAIRYWLNATGF